MKKIRSPSLCKDTLDDFGHITIKGTVLKQIVQCLNCIIS
jgi:hypothetical protein